MTARGANHNGTGNSGGFVAPANIIIASGTYSGVVNPMVPATGGAASTITRTTVNINGGTGGSTTRVWPPQAMTSTTTTISGRTDYGNGTYTISFSSSLATLENVNAAMAFDKIQSTSGSPFNFWHSATGYTASTGEYAAASTASTTINGVAVRGEWLQIQMPTAITVYSFSITPRADIFTSRSPTSFVLAGSSDGTNWTALDDEQGIVWSTANRQFFTTKNIVSCTHFRIVIRVVGNTGVASGRDSAQISELEFFDVPSSTNGGTGGGGTGALAASGTTTATSQPGTSFSGGTGTGGRLNSNGTSTANGGAGGDARGQSDWGAGGGAGNPGGIAGGAAGFAATAGDSGTGGTLIIICKGMYGGSGTVTANGANGGSGGTSGIRVGGGGSGGGSVTVICETANDTTTLTANGGTGGAGSSIGGAGGIGTTRKLFLYDQPRIWLRAQDLTSIADNGQITTWTSFVNGVVATGSLAGTATRPVLRRTLETYPFVRMGTGTSSSTNGNFFNFGSQTYNFATNGGMTVIANVRFYSTASWERLFDFGNGQGVDNVLFARNGTSTNFTTSYRNGSTETVVTYSGAVTGTWQSIATRISSTEMTIYDSLGEKVTSALTIPLQNRTFSNTFIGRSHWAFDGYANIDIRELLIYDGALPDDIIRRYIQVLNNKFV